MLSQSDEIALDVRESPRDSEATSGDEELDRMLADIDNASDDGIRTHRTERALEQTLGYLNVSKPLDIVAHCCSLACTIVGTLG